ncbi:hypothetical protein [Aeromicrobium massiliense]|uniref:hypothetical protein n=1 Tax=Aeromicrobium massiliense TaxID=1464554 RepID=UPI000B16DBE8|nr:hypothetical protein [Aeromicrobium massiliense]
MRTSRPASSVAATAMVLLAVLAGCGGPSDDATTAAGADAQGLAAAGATCFDAFPEAMGTPDLEILTMVPEGWPEPSVDATLCQTFQQSDGHSELVGYLVEQGGAADVLDGYESALSDMSLKRTGDVMTGTSGDASFTITVLSDTAFTLEFRR